MCIRSDNRVILLIAGMRINHGRNDIFYVEICVRIFQFLHQNNNSLVHFRACDLFFKCFICIFFFFIHRIQGTSNVFERKAQKKSEQGDIDSNSLCGNHSNVIADGKSFLNAGTRTKEKFVIVKTETVAAKKG